MINHEATAATIRRRDPVRTKAAILAAAITAFSELGYRPAGLREIAAHAGVASSLPVKYFGTKAALFEAALIEIVRANSVFSWQKEDFGKTMVRLMRKRSNVTITATLISALSDPDARDVAIKVWADHMIAPLADWLGPPDAQGRAGMLFGLLSGLTLQIHGFGGGEMTVASERWAAETLQALVDQGRTQA